MLTFYYHPLSPVARRVWIALLEKGLDYDPIVVNLRGEQLKPDFLALNPFHHVPVLVDDGFRVLESLAILDYLEQKYPSPRLLPSSPEAIATVRMVQMVTVNEITTKFLGLVMRESDPQGFEDARQHIDIALAFLDQQLNHSLYFGGDTLTLGDIVLGPTLSLSCRLGLSIAAYPALTDWFQRVSERESWTKTEPNDRDFAAWKKWVTLMVKRRQRQIANAS
ncbi:MAG: glutathione S-transferase family protein [Cyanobacteria bacterium P01_E01_bin.6]